MDEGSDHVKLNDVSNQPLKKPKNSPTTRVINISDSSSNSMTRPLLQNPIVTVTPPPTILCLGGCSKNKKKRTFATIIKKITKRVFYGGGKKRSDEEVKTSSSWIKSQFLGQGAFGYVYLAISKTGTSVMAMKSAEISQASSLMSEQRILSRLYSPFIVRYFGHEIVRENLLFSPETTKYNLILEYCSGKSLYDFIKNKGGRLPEKDVKMFARDILCGLDYIHREKIIHCDIKPDNILLAPADNQVRSTGYVTKIADFGLAMEKGSSEYGDGYGHTRGTVRYMSPEHLREGIVDYAGDVWAFGCTVLEMLTGNVAWEEHIALGPVNLVRLIGQSCFIPYIPSWLSEEAQDFLRRCLVRDPGSRWGIGALMNHPFLKVNVVV